MNVIFHGFFSIKCLEILSQNQKRGESKKKIKSNFLLLHQPKGVNLNSFNLKIEIEPSPVDLCQLLRRVEIYEIRYFQSAEQKPSAN